MSIAFPGLAPKVATAEPIRHEPVFRSVHHALHIAFLMEALPPTQKGSTQIFIEDLLRQNFLLDEVPEEERSFRVKGLSPIEIRGQCALVRAAVQDHLTNPERHVVWARFGQQITRTKAQGVAGLAEYLAPLCDQQSAEVVKALCWALFTPRTTMRDRTTGRTKEWSLRDIGRQYGVARSTLGETQKRIRHHSEALEKHALARLHELFLRTSLVPDEDEAHA